MAVGVILIVRVAQGQHDIVATLFDVGFVALVLIAAVISWIVTRWRVEGGDLRIETGLLRRSSQRYPLRQVQAIDVVATGLARVLGLAELRLRMAGGSSKGRLACLSAAHAASLREQLLQLSGTAAAATSAAAVAAVGATPAAAVPVGQPPAVGARADPGTPVVAVRTPQLLASLALSSGGLLAILYLTGLAVSAVLNPAAAAGLLGGGFAVVVGVGTSLWRRFNGAYGLTVHQSPDGLHLRSGLVQTTSETLPPGRIQALRVIEPLLWRPFGWCRVEAGVAGRRTREEDSAQSSRRRSLLPVGSYAQAVRIIDLLLPDTQLVQTRPPARSRWKAPLSYHRLSAGMNDRCAVTTSGRLRRVSHWVPLDKVQSIRRVQGPWQRRLRVATLHLDTAGPRMRAVFRDRDVAEIEVRLRDLPDTCAAARTLAAGR